MNTAYSVYRYVRALDAKAGFDGVPQEIMFSNARDVALVLFGA